MQNHKLVLTVSFACFGVGCASMFVSGGKITDHDYGSETKATYTSEVCVDVASGKPSEGSTATYLLVTEQGQPAMFERSTKGHGVVATNRWTAPDGEHFFTSVHHSGAHNGDGVLTGLFRSSYETGWEYIVPASGPGVRIVYNECTIAKGTDGIDRPTSAASIKCVLAPTQ